VSKVVNAADEEGAVVGVQRSVRVALSVIADDPLKDEE